MTNSPQKFLDRTAEYIRKHDLITKGDHVLAAVSGGPDSVALLHLLAHLKTYFGIRRITVVHFDHKLRGDESEADREFVRCLAGNAGLDFHCGTADVHAFAKTQKISIEMAARDCRHSFFKEMKVALSADRIALGHTAGDQAEEVLLRIIRGTGPTGLKGMRPRAADGIIRPLLFATRDEILNYLLSHHIDFRNDSSNSEPFCQRNFLRLHVFPLLQEKFHAEVVGTISRYAELAQEEESWWDSQVKAAWDQSCPEQSESLASSKSLISSKGLISLDLSALRKLHPALLRRLLRHGLERVKGNLSGIHSAHLEPLVAIISREKPGKSIRFPGEIEAVQRAGKLLIRKIDLSVLPPSLEISRPGTYPFGPFLFQIGTSDELIHGISSLPEPRHILMDACKIKWPLLIRSWNPGDRFCPLGMKGSKKLQDYFTDSKIPKEERKKIPILCDSEKICWVAGLRMDDRVKPSPGTTKIVTAQFSLSGTT
jgi:tRNA(Ile)-lysidine synthase